MRYAVVDNSTLTAVDRLLGRISVRNLHAIDGDIAAFENLIQSILFYDKIFFIDDYKEAFRAQRRNAFHFLTPIEKKSIPYSALTEKSLEITDDLVFEAQGGRIKDGEFAKFLNMLQMHTTFTWDMSSSKWFLTLKMLQGDNSIPIEKYSALHEQIFSERLANANTIAKEPSAAYLLLNSSGKPITRTASAGHTDDAISKQIEAFIANLSWLAQRAAFYTTFAANYNADAVLHPIRSAFLVNLTSRLGLRRTLFKPIIDLMSQQTHSAVRTIVEKTDPVFSQMDLPIFSAWIVNRTQDPSRVVEEAFELRSSEVFVRARAQLIELEQVIDNKGHAGYIKSVNSINRELEKTATSLAKKYGAKEPSQVSIAPLITIWNTVFPGAILPAIDINIPKPLQLEGLTQRSGFQGVLRSISHDLVAVERLGATHRLLSSKVRREPGAQSYNIKTEEERYFGKSSYWKRPM